MDLSPEKVAALDAVYGQAQSLAPEKVAALDAVYGVAPPEAPKEQGFFSRVGDDISNRVQQGREAARASVYDGTGGVTAAFQAGGKVVGGSINDIVGEAIKSGFNMLPEQQQQMYKAMGSAAVNSKAGQLVAEGAGVVKQGYDKFAQTFPSQARTLEAAANFAGAAPTVKAVYSAGNKAVTMAPKVSKALNSFEAASQKLPGIIGNTKSGAVPVAGGVNDDILGAGAKMRYDAAEAAGAQIKPAGFSSTVDDIKRSVPNQTPEGAAFAGDNAVTDVVARLDELRGKPISLAGLDEIVGDIDSKISVAMRGGDRVTASKLSAIKGKLKNMSETVKPEDLVNPDGFKEWRAGDTLWTAKSKIKQLQNIAEDADFTQNPDTSMRLGMKNLAKQLRKNPQGWTPEEIEAITRGGKFGVGEGALKFIGGRIPSAMIGGAIGSTGGPLGAAAGIVAGELAGAPIRAAGRAMQEARLMRPANMVANRASVQGALPNQLKEIAKLPKTQQKAALEAMFQARKGQPK